MPLYRYKSIAQDGKIRLGSLDAANEVELEKRLSRMHLELIHAQQSRGDPLDFRRGRVNRTDLIVFCMHLGQLIRAGAPMIDSLCDLRDSMEQPYFKEIINNVIDDIESGTKLSAAMAGYPKIFNNLFVNLVAAGEASGKLAEALESLAEMLKWQDEISSNTRKLLTTPVIVACVVLGVALFLMVFLVPQLVTFLENAGESLPIHTRALIATSSALTSYWYLVIGIPVIATILLLIMIRTNERFRFHFDNFKLHIWKAGSVYKKILLSRFANFFAMMYSAGIPILTSLKISEGIVNNRVLKAALEQARIEIEQGKPISQGFASTGIFPPLVIRMLKIGEARGELDKALLDVRYFYERDIDDAVNTLQSLIQPLMTLVLAMLLGWVMLSVLGPVYSSLNNIS